MGAAKHPLLAWLCLTCCGRTWAVPSVACPDVQQGTLQVCDRCVHDDLTDTRLNIKYKCHDLIKKCVDPAWNNTEVLVQCPEDPLDPKTWGAQCKFLCTDQQLRVGEIQTGQEDCPCSMRCWSIVTLVVFATTVAALPELPELPRSNSTLNLTCFGWRLKWPELILSNSGAYLHGLSINSSQLQSIRHVIADLVVVDDKQLRNLDQLSNLQTVGGNVEIRYNSELDDISGLSNVEVIGGSMNMEFNNKLSILARLVSSVARYALPTITSFKASQVFPLWCALAVTSVCEATASCWQHQECQVCAPLTVMSRSSLTPLCRRLMTW
eukprot:symbB.v1.2.031348.t1/scaffold3626.1/size81632/5